ncbi:MAG TPA: SDR family oxidoreductase [Capsulimonadaceae bacterium]|jgi:ribitol 2-dehydrogenase
MPKVVLITGASSGIGAATARAVVARGWNAILFARSEGKLGALADELGDGDVLVTPGDVTVSDDLNKAIAQGTERFGKIDAVFANAGKFGFDDLVHDDPDEWASMVDVNINGVMRTVRAALPGMVERKAGQIVLTASIAGRAVYPNSAVYAGTKHFLYGWAVGLRKQVSQHGISVGIISPGYVLNELWGETPGSENQLAQVNDSMALTSEDIADAVAYMLDKPAHVNIADMLVLATKQDVPGY